MTRAFRSAWIVLPLALALAAGGCSILRGGPRAEPAATASTANSGDDAGQIDVRRFIGPDYCPELRILDGAELIRRYDRGHDDDPNFVMWQASFGETARECLYDQQGNLTIKVGVSGRVIAGPKGGAAEVTVPFKIAVVRFKEAVLATEGYTVAASMPAAGSSTFTEVHEITVPSPGSNRDYIIYVGFDVGEWDLEAGTVAIEPVKEQPSPPPPPLAEEPALLVQEEEEPAAAAAPPPKKKKAEPEVLPTPSEGFILRR